MKCTKALLLIGLFGLCSCGGSKSNQHSLEDVICYYDYFNWQLVSETSYSDTYGAFDYLVTVQEKDAKGVKESYIFQETYVVKAENVRLSHKNMFYIFNDNDTLLCLDFD